MHVVISTLVVSAFLVTAVLSCENAYDGPISVLDHDCNAIDWIIIIKFPWIHGTKDQLLTNHGLGYMFMTPKSQSWELGKVGFTASTGHSIANTLSQFYEKQDKDKHVWVFYNDEPSTDVPPKPDWLKPGNGHSKGYLFFDDESGFWCVHSGPKFPLVKSYAWPTNLFPNGQSWLCVSFKADMLPLIAQQLVVNDVYPYHFNIPPTMRDAEPALLTLDEHCKFVEAEAKALRDKKAGIVDKSASQRRPAARGSTTTPPAKPFNVAKLKSANAHTQFVSFAKSTEFRKDIWADLIATKGPAGLATGFKVQSWRKEGPHQKNMETSCSSNYHVYNILKQDIKIGDFEVQIDNGQRTNDHAKWGCATDAKKPWCCIGDINRQEGQKNRGGGFLCLKLKRVYDAFMKDISVTEECPAANPA